MKIGGQVKTAASAAQPCGPKRLSYVNLVKGRGGGEAKVPPEEKKVWDLYERSLLFGSNSTSKANAMLRGVERKVLAPRRIYLLGVHREGDRRRDIHPAPLPRSL